MKRNHGKRIASIGIAVIMLTITLCQVLPFASAAEAPVEISFIAPDGGRVVREGNPIIQEIERRTNTIIKEQLVPSAEFTSKYNVLVASDSLPDVTSMNGFSYQKYALQDVFLELSDLLTEYGPNILAYEPVELFELAKIQGQLFGIPKYNTSGKWVPVVRADWLETLGLEPPSTLEAYEEMLVRFSQDDPDGNGKNDTYGLGAIGNWESSFGSEFHNIFGAYGFAIGQSKLVDGKVIPSFVSDEYREAVTFIHKLWDEKVIDPEIFTVKADQALQNLVMSKAGSFTAWWSIAPAVLVAQLKMKEITPATQWDPLPELLGADGVGGVPSSGSFYGTINVSAKTKNPIAVIKLLDYLWSDEGFILSNYGIEGVHYTNLVDPRLPEGQAASEEKWLDSLGCLINRTNTALDDLYLQTTDPEKIENNRFIAAGYAHNLYVDLLYGIPETDESSTFAADLSKYQIDWFIKFVTGAEPLSNWDAYVDGWKAKGGSAVLESMVKSYNELKGTDYKPGI